jgi:hypothetical protein
MLAALKASDYEVVGTNSGFISSRKCTGYHSSQEKKRDEGSQ